METSIKKDKTSYLAKDMIYRIELSINNLKNHIKFYSNDFILKGDMDNYSDKEKALYNISKLSKSKRKKLSKILNSIESKISKGNIRRFLSYLNGRVFSLSNENRVFIKLKPKFPQHKNISSSLDNALKNIGVACSTKKNGYW
jgi:chromosome condensin MukBEF ATPase and DNA-binding subunit MukB